MHSAHSLSTSPRYHRSFKHEWIKICQSPVHKLAHMYLPLSSIRVLNLMLLVNDMSYMTNTKCCKTVPEKWLIPWHMVTHLRLLSESYPINTDMTGFRWFSKIFVFLCFGRILLALASKVLRKSWYIANIILGMSKFNHISWLQ